MRRFTLTVDGNAIIIDHMKIISEFVQEKVSADLAALVLSGSFGRGEGSVLQREDGRIEPVNDYDFVVVVRTGVSVPPRSELASWEAECSRLTGMRWIDFAAISEERLPRLSLTQANYDLKFGGQVIAGREDVLASIPDYRAEDIPLKEAQTLLTTRFWCFIGTEPQKIIYLSETLTAKDRRFVLQQLSKALIASGDSLLMLRGKYCVKYAEKAHRIADLFGVQEAERRLMEWGYAYKLGETKTLPEGYALPELFLAALNIHLTTWDCVRKETPCFKGLFCARLLGGVRQVIRRGRITALRGVLLDRIQLRLLRFLRRTPQQKRVGRVNSILLWFHCGEWISSTVAYAAKVAELRLK